MCLLIAISNKQTGSCSDWRRRQSFTCTNTHARPAQLCTYTVLKGLLINRPLGKALVFPHIWQLWKSHIHASLKSQQTDRNFFFLSCFFPWKHANEGGRLSQIQVVPQRPLNCFRDFVPRSWRARTSTRFFYRRVDLEICSHTLGSVSARPRSGCRPSAAG